MEITVFVKELIPLQQGTSASGKAWQKCGFVGETGGQYSQDIAFTLFGDKNIAKCPQVGQQVTVQFDVSSRKGKNGGWFHDINAFQVTPVGAQAVAQPQQQYAAQQQPYNGGWGNQVVYPNQQPGAVVNGQSPQFSQMQGQPQQTQQNDVPF